MVASASGDGKPIHQYAKPDATPTSAIVTSWPAKPPSPQRTAGHIHGVKDARVLAWRQQLRGTASVKLRIGSQIEGRDHDKRQIG